MRYQSVDRGPTAFQQPLTPAQIEAVCAHAFGAGTVVDAAIELDGGLYNTTYRLDVRGMEPVILRVAPAEERQSRTERHFMRNELAVGPYLSPIAHLVPRTIAADVTHRIVDRDWMIQALVPGTAAPDVVRDLGPEARAAHFREMGELHAALHGVRGEGFGMVAGPLHPTWSAAILGWLDDTIADVVDAGLDASDLRTASDLVGACAAVLDEVTDPRLSHGDMWELNVLVQLVDGMPRVTGVLDADRAFWGDPMADWAMQMLVRRADPAVSEPFWQGYGTPPARPGDDIRSLAYQVRFVAADRVEGHRLGHREGVAATYRRMETLISALREVTVHLR